MLVEISSLSSNNEKIPISGIACDATGMITDFGKGAEELFGWKASELIGKERVTIFHTEENIQKLVPRLLQTASEKGVFEEEIMLLKKGGESFRAILNVRPLKDGDQIVGFMGTTRTVV